MQSYLPHSDGRIVCGCFTPRKNRRAPVEIDIGKGPEALPSARELVSTGATIPVFVKRATNAWTFRGYFRAVGLSQEEADIRGPDRRPDATAVIFLEEVAADTPGPTESTELFEAAEGDLRLANHLRRERRRSLVEVKKRLALETHGALICECCSLSSCDLPLPVGSRCFEVHHLIPLAALVTRRITRIDELALVCANCHRMIHAQVEPLTISALSQLIKEAAEPRASSGHLGSRPSAR
jgi:hypothetical protein